MISKYYKDAAPLDEIPHGVKLAANYLKAVGLTSISLVGICWGGCIVQQIISTG